MSGLGAPSHIPPQSPGGKGLAGRQWDTAGRSEKGNCVGREESLGGSQLFLPLLQVNLVIISLRTG